MTTARALGVICAVALFVASGCQNAAPSADGSSSATPSDTAAEDPPGEPNAPSADDPEDTSDLEPSDGVMSIEPDPEMDAWTLEQITWVEGDDDGPRLDFVPPLGVTGPVARVVDPGTGAEISEGDSVTFDYAMFAGDTGELAYSTHSTGDTQTISISPQAMSQTFAEALVGNRVGAHIIFATIDSSQTTMSDTPVAMFMAVTVNDSRTLPTRAEGEEVPAVPGLPVVTRAANGEPSIDIPSESTPPHELVSQDLIRGDGPAVAEGDTATLAFSAWLWDGTQFDSTWPDGASMAWRMIQGESMPGLIEGLIGKTVGSQVLLVIPPALAFGDLEMEGIPPNSTLVYVADILDAR